MNDLAMFPGAKSLVLRSNDQQRWKLSNYRTTRQVLGWNAKSGESEQSGPYNALPPNEWFWRVTADASNVSADSYIGMDVKIKYYCRLFKETPVNES